jgi:hypothetical protein
MNKNQIVLIVAPFLLIFGYQNCQKANFDPAASGVEFSTQKQVIPLSEESVEGLQFKSNKAVQVVNGGSSYSVIKSFLYDFDLSTGEINVVDQQSQASERYCLTEAMKSQLQVLIQNSSVCKDGDVAFGGQVCAQVIQEGYANLITNRDHFRLGSSTDSCGSNRVDLCDGSIELKNWFESIKPVLSSLSCQ